MKERPEFINFTDITKGGHQPAESGKRRDIGATTPRPFSHAEGEKAESNEHVAFPSPTENLTGQAGKGEARQTIDEASPLDNQPHNRPDEPFGNSAANNDGKSKEPEKSLSKLKEEDPLGELVYEVFGESMPWKPGKKTIKFKNTYEFIDTPQEKARKRAEVPEAERERLEQLMSEYSFRAFSEDKWGDLICNPYLRRFLDTLNPDERKKWGYKQELINLERKVRIKDFFENMYPLWWEVYDKKGNRIWKMSRADKASLERMGRSNRLSDEVDREPHNEGIDAQIREEMSRGEKIAKSFEAVVDLAVALILALISTNAENRSNNPAASSA